jgi:hypothetical protein
MIAVKLTTVVFWPGKIYSEDSLRFPDSFL